MREGWKEINLEGKKIRTCGRCQWYYHRLVKSGNNPIYANMCTHPDAKEKGIIKLLRISQSQGIGSLYKGNLDQNIHGYVEPAEWCPYTEAIERELKINQIIDENK